MMMKYILALTSASLLLLSGCQQEDIRQTPDTHGMLAVKFSKAGMINGTDADAESQIHTLNGYHFEDGILKETFSSLQMDAEGICHLDIAPMKGSLYFLANGEKAITPENLKEGVTTLEAFLKQQATAENMASESMLMTGKTELGTDDTSVSVTMKRAVARIDLDSPFEDAEVNSVVLKNVALTGYLYEQDALQTSEKFETTDLTKDFGKQPFKNDKTSLFYLPEQNSNGHEVEIMITTHGGWHRLKTTLPALKRNHVYTLKVYGNGSNWKVEVLTNDWETGSSSESGLTHKGLVDKENSQLSEGVTLSAQADTVFVPYWKSDFQLTLAAEAGAEVTIQGQANGVTVTPTPLSRSLTPVAQFQVSSKQKMPGSHYEYMYLDVHKNEVQTGRVVLVFIPNPIQMTGTLQFDDNGLCDFNTYVDGELARITLPEGKTISLNFNEGEAQWMKLTEEGDRTYRLLGGWKPNDPKADGRAQTGELVIADANGGHSEVYTIRRLNWGLPVVQVNGVWWCKYNLRGNVKNFSDQILIKSDPAANGSLADYLRSCSDEDFLQVLGDQYQAGNPDGLKLTHQDGQFYYEGYQSQTGNFGTMAPTEMAPDGYQIPDYDDYRFYTWGSNCNLAYFDPGVFNNGLGQRLNFNVVERDATFKGLNYGQISFYDFEYEGNHLTLCGLGHQYNETTLSSMMILFATYGNSGNTWMIEGYAKSTGKGNWFKYAGSNAQKTRTIRCIKTPVEYIYE
ncbi:FimB/Mfa2 family fimbrial subunit [Bacteroides mediterraneensis]|uniref:FimB/Mfa2 family fimbrial subunit n=1 Tax=Bacteroides mediterraneensis TaxID=1841856 RepID=A0ABS2ERY7_9BACE|nr:FimB/Mfa2 family fimbrial subunit [Bacteroides mediterraneensis]MBM6757432.1 FimB/Mfa2 family fimbrial subunit [Bacteroides mediterraneensis]